MRERRHLRRLPSVWVRKPVYFLTLCTHGRRRILHLEQAAKTMMQSFQDALVIHGWAVGRYVIMPDHVHLFCIDLMARKSLAAFVRDWKRWCAARMIRDLGLLPPIWQREFFDHVLRSPGSYADKWNYVRENPVRAGLVTCADDWPYQGECETFGF